MVLRMGLCCQHTQPEAHRKKNPLHKRSIYSIYTAFCKRHHYLPIFTKEKAVFAWERLRTITFTVYKAGEAEQDWNAFSLCSSKTPHNFSSIRSDLRGCSRMTSYLKSFDVTTFRVEKMSWSQLPQLMELLLHRELPKACPGVVWGFLPFTAEHSLMLLQPPLPLGKAHGGIDKAEKTSLLLLLPELQMHIKA